MMTNSFSFTFKKSLFKNRLGLSFVELLVSITIMAVVGGVAIVSFGHFFEGQEKNRIETSLESTIKKLDLEIQDGLTSDYTLTLSGNTLGYVIEKNKYKKATDLLTTLSYDFDTNSGTLSRNTPGKPWTIDLYAENKLQKTFLTNDATQVISLPDSNTRRESYTLKSRIDGESSNSFVIHLYSPQDKTTEPIRLRSITPSGSLQYTNTLGKKQTASGTLLFEQASKEFEVVLQ